MGAQPRSLARSPVSQLARDLPSMIVWGDHDADTFAAILRDFLDGTDPPTLSVDALRERVRACA